MSLNRLKSCVNVLLFQLKITVAEDMYLLSLSKAGLDKLLAICYQYFCKCRYEYVPIKCSVIVFNETKKSK